MTSYSTCDTSNCNNYCKDNIPHSTHGWRDRISDKCRCAFRSGYKVVSAGSGKYKALFGDGTPAIGANGIVYDTEHDTQSAVAQGLCDTYGTGIDHTLGGGRGSANHFICKKDVCPSV